MIELTLKEILEATGGVARGALPGGNIASITTDSRQAAEGSVFIALKGERVDGHSFVPGLEGRAMAAIVEHEIDCALPQIVVDSTYRAVGAIGAYIRNRSGVIVVGVTGSVACYKAIELMRALLHAGMRVSATLTPAAREFVTAIHSQPVRRGHTACYIRKRNPCFLQTLFQKPVFFFQTADPFIKLLNL